MKLWMLFSLILSLVVSFGCNSSDFAGAAKKERAQKEDKEEDSNDLDDDTEHDNGKLGKEGDDPEETGKEEDEDEQPVDLGTNSDDAVPKDDTLSDFLGGLLDTMKDEVVEQPNDDELIFGRDKVFHIGDNAMSGSSCLDQITTFAIKGRRYYFE